MNSAHLTRVGCLVGCLVLLAIAVSAQRRPGRDGHAPPPVVTAGQLPWGAVKQGAITVRNPHRADKRKECKEAHDFRVSVDADAARFLRLPEDPTVHDVPLGGERQLVVTVDTSGLPRPPLRFSDTYEGVVTTTCLTCGSCALERQQVRLRLVVFDTGDAPGEGRGAAGAEQGGSPGGGGTRPPGSSGLPGGSDPREPRRVCGPDVSSAMTEMLRRVDRRLRELPRQDRSEQGAAAFKARNADRSVTVAPGSSCPHPPEHCGGTVTLFGTCLPEHSLLMVLEGYLDGWLHLPDPLQRSASEELGIEEDTTPEEARNLATYRAGRALVGALTMISPTDPNLEEDFARTWKDEVSVSPRVFETHRDCVRCTEAGRLTSDWSLLDWKLHDGKVQLSPKSGGRDR